MSWCRGRLPPPLPRCPLCLPSDTRGWVPQGEGLRLSDCPAYFGRQQGPRLSVTCASDHRAVNQRFPHHAPRGFSLFTRALYRAQEDLLLTRSLVYCKGCNRNSQMGQTRGARCGGGARASCLCCSTPHSEHICSSTDKQCDSEQVPSCVKQIGSGTEGWRIT